jgi:hypothetical protein
MLAHPVTQGTSQASHADAQGVALFASPTLGLREVVPLPWSR